MATVKQELSLLQRQAAAIRLLREQMQEELAEIDQRSSEPWIGHPRQLDFERSFAEHERAMAACTCQWDSSRLARHDCPTHREEDLDGGCEFCPNCGWETNFTEHESVHREPYGEFVDDVWLTCNRCKKRTDAEEVKSFNKYAESEGK